MLSLLARRVALALTLPLTVALAVAGAAAAPAGANGTASPRVDPEALCARWSPSVVSLGVVSVASSSFGQCEVEAEGIISGIGRTVSAPDDTQITDALQTDAAINAGRSGGPPIAASGTVGPQ